MKMLSLFSGVGMIDLKLKRPRILTIYKHKGKYTPAEVISP